MSRKLYCSNLDCKFHMKDKCNAEKIHISSSGCDTFEKGLHYYFNLVWDALEHTNMITEDKLTDDMRIGLYYVMQVYKLGFNIKQWGSWRILTLQADENSEGLDYEGITSRKIDDEAFEKIFIDFNNGILPKVKEEKHAKDRQPFGWLSPTAEFIKGDWGDHEAKARDIIENKHFNDEFEQWEDETVGRTARDFLTEVKGYALIHNPSLTS